MQKARLSARGQIVVPKNIRVSKNWKPGTELTIEERPEGVLLRPVRPLPETKIEDVIGILKYTGKTKTIEEMDAGITAAIRRRRDSGRY